MAKLRSEKTAVTPRQWAMMGALGLVLLGAIYWPGDEAATLDAGAEAASAPSRGAVAARLAALRAKGSPRAKQWPAVDLDEALSHDPFSSTLLSPPSAPTEIPVDPRAIQQAQTADLLALKEDGVSIILRNKAGRVATVGDRKLRVGDVIDGYRVSAIEMDGVVLERVKTDSTDH